MFGPMWSDSNDSQEPHQENKTNLNLILDGELQLPDQRLGQNQDPKVRQHVERSHGYTDCKSEPTLGRIAPISTYGPTFEENSEQSCDEPDNDPSGPKVNPNLKPPLMQGEDPSKKRQNGQFAQQHAQIVTYSQSKHSLYQYHCQS